MTVVRQPVLSPIRFHDPSLEFDNETNFQNPDNRLSTGYDWEGVNEVPYHLPIPKQWPDYQPGIDFMMNQISGSSAPLFYAKLYDSDDNEYKDLYVNYWATLTVGSLYQFHVFLDGVSGSGIEDGYYTVKIFQISDDELLLESEALLIAEWFIDTIPFEFWNFENDFGIYWAEDSTKFTGRIMVPIRLFDPSPTFEKEQYKDDPGTLTTLRTVPQRVFNFDSHPIPVHLAELIQLGFGCSELYLDRIKINSEDVPEAEIYEGTNLKYLTGQATFIDFNDDYIREVVDTEQEDQSIDWDTDTYDVATITGNSIDVDTPSVVATFESVVSDSITVAEDDLILVKLTLMDDAGDSDLPQFNFLQHSFRVLEWGISWFSFRVNAGASGNAVNLTHFQNEKAVYTGVIETFKIV